MDLSLARHEAENFLADYTDAVDRRDFAALTALVADAAVLLPTGATVEGGAAVADLYRRVLAPDPDGHHLVTNVRVTVDGARIRADCRYHFIGGPQLRTQVLGRYRTEFALRDDRLVPLRHTVVREFESAPDVIFAADQDKS